jgi:hypothetical protein
VTALPDGALLIPTPLSQGPVRHEPIWQDAERARVTFLRDEAGRVVRCFFDRTGAQSHEGLRGLEDPVWLWLSLGIATVLSI